MTDYYVTHSPHVSWRRLKEYVLIIDHKNKNLITLDDVAGTIWEQADCCICIDLIINRIKEIYDVDNQTAERDVKTLIEQFIAQDLLISKDYNSIKPSDNNNVNLQYFGKDVLVDLRSMCVKNKIPLVGCIEITEQCNLSCQHCYNAPKRNAELSFTEITSLLDNLATLGCIDLIITGGEPTLHPKFLDIIWHARKRKFSITIKTNAIKIDERIALSLNEAFVNQVHVSVYSILQEEHDEITGIHDSLSKTIRGIRNLVDAGVQVQIACPLTKINYRSVRLLKEWASTNGILCAFDPIITAKVDGDRSTTSLRLGQAELDELYDNNTYSTVIFPNTINTSDASPTEIATFRPELENLPICGAGSSMVFISAYGDVFPCIALPLDAGNIRDKPLKDLWNNSTELRKVRSLTFGKYNKCIECDKIEYCMRCPGVFYSDTGNFQMPSPAICLLAGYAKKNITGGEIND